MSIIEFQHENLVIHTHARYYLQNGKRVYFKSNEKKEQETWFEFEATMYPPLMLSPVAWKRYEYTVEDVHNTYEKLDASYMWQLALMLLCGQNEIESVSTGIRFTFQSLFTFLTISRKSVFSALIDSQSAYICKRQGSSLCAERPDHKPLLPKVQVTQDVYDRCCFMVPEHAPSFRRVTIYDQFVPFKDILLVPVEHDKGNELILMHRVISKATYDSIPVKPRRCPVTMEIYVKSKSGSHDYVMLDEACFFECKDRKRKCVQMKSNVLSQIKRARYDS